MELTSKERFDRILKHQPVDRVGLFEVFWRETVQRWTAEGHFARPEMVSDHFGLDVRRTGGEITPGDYHIVNLMANLDAGDQVVEETESAKLIRDGNGALLRWLKSGSGAPEHVDFTVKDRRGWEEHIRPYLLDERIYERRLNFSSYREVRAKCARDQRFMTCGVVGAFDRMSPMCGHEHLLMGMALDPDWVARWPISTPPSRFTCWRSSSSEKGCRTGSGSGMIWASSTGRSCPRRCTGRCSIRRTRSSSTSPIAAGCRWSSTATATWRRSSPL